MPKRGAKKQSKKIQKADKGKRGKRDLDMGLNSTSIKF